MKASRLRSLDREFELNLAAWQGREIETADPKGRYIYTDFKKFMDFEERENALLGRIPPKTEKSENKLLYLMAKANQTKKGGG